MLQSDLYKESRFLSCIIPRRPACICVLNKTSCWAYCRSRVRTALFQQKVHVCIEALEVCLVMTNGEVTLSSAKKKESSVRT